MVILHQYWVFPFSRHWDHVVPAKSISWALRGFRECGIRHEPCPVLPQLCDGGCCPCTSPAPPAWGWWTTRQTKPYPSHHRAVFLLRRARLQAPSKLPGFLLVLRLRRHSPCSAAESEDLGSTALSPWAARRPGEIPREPAGCRGLVLEVSWEAPWLQPSLALLPRRLAGCQPGETLVWAGWPCW